MDKSTLTYFNIAVVIAVAILVPLYIITASIIAIVIGGAAFGLVGYLFYSLKIKGGGEQ